MSLSIKPLDAQPASLTGSRDDISDFPGLELVGERFARGLTDLFAGIGLGSALVRRSQTQMFSTADWEAAASPKSANFRFQLKPIKGSMLFCVPNGLIMQLVDIFYGGDGLIASDDRDFSNAEQRFLTRIGEQCLPLLTAAWKDMIGINPVMQSVDVGAGRLPRSKDNDPLAVQTLVLTGDGIETTEIKCLFPLSALRPIATLREPVDTEATASIDAVWQERLEETLMQVRLPVRSVFARPELPLQKLLSLAVGDIISVPMPRQIPLTIGGRLFAHGSVGEANGRTAIKIESIQQGKTA